jgi:hypothetical protein
VAVLAQRSTSVPPTGEVHHGSSAAPPGVVVTSLLGVDAPDERAAVFHERSLALLGPARSPVREVGRGAAAVIRG